MSDRYAASCIRSALQSAVPALHADFQGHALKLKLPYVQRIQDITIVEKESSA